MRTIKEALEDGSLSLEDEIDYPDMSEEEYKEEIERLNSIINNDFSKICREKMIDKLSANEMILLQDKEIERLNKESKILRENAEHNDKVVDKVNWENKRLNNIINKIEEHFVFLKMNSTGGNKEFFEDILDFIKALKELKGSDKE